MDDKRGIPLLLAAEEDAQHIVGNARAARTQRLRQAKDEAERDIAAYRSERNSDFYKNQEVSSGSVDSTVKRLEKDTDNKIQALKEEAMKVKESVSNILMHYVTTVSI
ncbi:unnamed protein product [Calypogeia fissa]